MTIENGIGQSIATAEKQDGLKRILEQHLAIVRAIWLKQKSRWFSPVYQYIDINAGCGYNETVDCEGSPLVFLESVSRFPIRYQANFIEIEPTNTIYLRGRLADYNHYEIHTGDNRDILPIVVDEIPDSSFGILYTDPNGIPDFGLLEEVSKHPKMKLLDILIRYNSAAVKRNIHLTGQRMADHLKAINKKFWIIREPERRSGWQWTFLLGANSDCINPMKRHGFYYLHSEEGQDVLEKLNYTKEEWQALHQPDLFLADPPYTTYDEYLQHPQFRAIRAVVIRRSKGVCEKCGKRAVTEVHHLEYPEWGQFDVPENLIAVCHRCHSKIHGKEN